MAKGKINRCVGFGIFLAILSLGATVIAFGTNHWVTVTNKGKNGPNRHEVLERHYGIIKECMEPGVFENATDYAAHGIKGHEAVHDGTQCVYINYHMPPQLGVIGALTTEEWTRIHLMRTTFGLMVSAIFLLFLAVILGLYSVCADSSSLHRFVTLLLCFAAFFVAAAIAFFHGTYFLEQNELIDSSDKYDDGRPKQFFMKGLEKRTLHKDLNFRFSWSYIVGWVGCGLAWIASVFFACSGRLTTKSKAKNIVFGGQSTSSMMPLEYAAPNVIQGPVYPPEDYSYFHEGPHEYVLEDPRQSLYPQMPYEVLEEYYTPDGKPLGPPAPPKTNHYIDHRQMIKY